MLITLIQNLNMTGGAGVTGSGTLVCSSCTVSGTGSTPIVQQEGGAAPWWTEPWRKKREAWPLPPPTFPPVEEPVPVLAFGDTKTTEHIPHWTDRVEKKPLTVHRELVLPMPTRVPAKDEPVRYKKIVRPIKEVREMNRPDDVTADEIIRKWKRQEEEDVIVAMIMQNIL